MAVPTFIAVGAWAVDISAPVSVTPTPPAHLENDILLVMAVSSGAVAVATTTEGWSEIAHMEGAVNLDVYWFWKRATGAGTAGPELTAITDDVGAICYVFRGCAQQGTPYEDPTVNEDDTGDITPESSEITTTDVDRLVVASLGGEPSVFFLLGFPPTDWTADSNVNTPTGTGFNSALMSRAVAGASTVAAVNFGTYVAANRCGTLTLAFIGPTNFIRNFDDTVTLSDTNAKATGLPQVDSLSVSDAQTKVAGLGRSDNVALSDALPFSTLPGSPTLNPSTFTIG